MDKNLLQQIEQIIKNALKGFATKDDLKNLSTKDDLRNLEKDLTKKMDTQREDIVKEISDNINGLMESVDRKKASQEDLDDLDRRVDRLERKVSR